MWKGNNCFPEKLGCWTSTNRWEVQCAGASQMLLLKVDSCSGPVAGDCADKLGQDGVSACKDNRFEGIRQRCTPVLQYKMRIVQPGGEVKASVRQKFGGG